MNRKIVIWLLTSFCLTNIPLAEAQQAKVHRVGVITPGGLWYETIAGLRTGLKELGLEEGNNYFGNPRYQGRFQAEEEAARISNKRKST